MCKQYGKRRNTSNGQVRYIWQVSRRLTSNRKTDPYARLRVPLYTKVFESLFTASFLVLYYAALFERNEKRITVTEIFLFIWIAAFAYDEFGEFQDTGSLFYTRDFWNYWDVGVLLVGIAFLITRTVGLARGDQQLVSTSFDILSLEALFLVPKLFSLLSLNTYFGTLIPCLKEMTKDFIKFLVIVIVLYVGFLTTFTMLGREELSVPEISWDLVYVFFGAATIGFDVARRISTTLGPPLMIIFVCMTNILLITSLISLLSNSLTRVMDHAREEYFFQYSVFVLDASASKRLTYFFPPLNLIPLALLRPLRLCLPGRTVRSFRISLLKATHGPFVAAIWAYEGLRARLRGPDPEASWYARPASSHPELRPRTQSHTHSLRRRGAAADAGSADQQERNLARAAGHGRAQRRCQGGGRGAEGRCDSARGAGRGPEREARADHAGRARRGRKGLSRGSRRAFHLGCTA